MLLNAVLNYILTFYLFFFMKMPIIVVKMLVRIQREFLGRCERSLEDLLHGLEEDLSTKK